MTDKSLNKKECHADIFNLHDIEIHLRKCLITIILQSYSSCGVHKYMKRGILLIQ